MKRTDPIIPFLRASLLVTALTVSGTAQTTAFTYQGKLTDAGNPANGNYDLQFKLFDTATVGTGVQQGSTIPNPTVQVANGIFTVELDLGANVFDGTARYLEIAVRPAGNPNPHAILAPRQPITSSPYAIQNLKAAQLGGLPASRYVATDTNGKVGIGTSSPSQRLHIFSGNAAALVQTPTNSFAQFQLQSGATNPWIIGTQDNFAVNGLLFRNGVTDLMAIQPGGNVGIGTSSPIQLLHIKSQTGLNAAALIEAPVGFFAQYQLQSGADNPWIIGTQDSFSNGALLFRKGATDFMAIRQSGNVGIGTTSPVGKLHIEGGGLTGLSLLTTGPVSIGGYATQLRDKGGMVKAMVFVNGDGTLLRCYNGVTGSSTGNCGFTTGRTR